MVAFSDGVIAIAITLLVLEIRPPHDTRSLLHGLAALWPSYLAYVLAFLLIGQVWANHHIMFDHIRSADRVVLFLNTVLLMDVAFLPFDASVLAETFRDGHGQRTAVVLFGAAFELVAILFNVIWWHVRRDRRWPPRRAFREDRGSGLFTGTERLPEVLLGCGVAGALVVAPCLHTVTADGHRAPAGLVGLAAVDEEPPAFRVGTRS